MGGKMKASYQELRNNPIKVNIKKGVKEVVLEIVSAMCDNKHTFRFKKDENGEFKLNTCGFSYSNFQIKSHNKIDLEWLADDGKWQEIVNAINSGVQKVYEIKQR